MYGLPIFSNSRAANIILEGLAFLRNERDVTVTAYVIMENHLHAILRGDNLEAKVGQFKSYSARRIIDLFKDYDRSRWLKRLGSVNPKADRDYQFWQEGFHPKQLIGDKMMRQKISYIHNNPVKRGYVEKPEHWRYSSARNYSGMEALIPVDLFKARGA